MRLLPSDPDIQTLVGRIKNGDIDLQPDFQRGEVWSLTKQRRLIDSVLRDWHVPPIHVVQYSESKKQEVLDGQQRLAAIRDFVNGFFTIDGKTEPFDDKIWALNGMRYSDLPGEWKRQFDQFTIRVFRIVDFSPDEPAELFFRLNQPVSLTSAEQRNAFFGPVRSQVKEIAALIDELPLGFSNSRMAIDDVIARVGLSIESGTIREKLTAAKLTQRYRERVPFSNETLNLCKEAVKAFAYSASDRSRKLTLNKATLFSWLWASACLSKYYRFASAGRLIENALNSCEQLRSKFDSETSDNFIVPKGLKVPPALIGDLVALFNDRSSSRVSDVFSVIARDVVIWVFIANAIEQSDTSPVDPYSDLLSRQLFQMISCDRSSATELVTELIESHGWGGIR
jgi:hypothetical protein